MYKYLRGFKRVFLHPLNRGKFFSTFTRLIWWQVNRAFFNYSVIVQIKPNASIICRPNSSYGSLVIYTQLPEYNEQEFMYQYVEPSDTIIDIGAHIGSETILLASKLGKKGKIFSFEPTPSTFAELQQNISINTFSSQVYLEQLVVSRSNSIAKFYLGETSETNSLGEDPNAKSITLQCVTLDRYALKKHIKHINLLKVDVEGFESDIMQGARKLLQNHQIDCMVIEINSRGSTIDAKNHHLINDLTNRYNYDLYLVNESQQLIPYRFLDQVHNLIAISPKLSKVKRHKLHL